MHANALRTARAVAVCATLGIAASWTIGASPQSPPSPDPLPALLAEVRALRVAMEQQATIGPRLQVTLTRLNIEEQRVTHLSAELDAARQRLMALDGSIRGISERLAIGQQQLPIETDPVKRRQLEVDQREMERVLRQQTTEQEALRTRENDAAQALASEQARWTELNGRLDEIERLLGPVR